MVRQRGLSLLGLIVTLAILGFVGLMAAKLLPSYVEYWNVRKMFAQMEKNGSLNGTPHDIRREFDKLNAISDVRSIGGKDLEVANQGGQTVVGADWSVKVPLVANISACIHFSASTGETAESASAQQ